MGSLPKLSYVLLSHNREKYIRAAIESAFAQEYEGELEYIFSDDCSTDRTYEIIQECVAAYKGNRKVIVTQTPHNMHLAGNTNHAVQFATGDYVIRADDDDLSAVNRCAVIGRVVSEHPDCKCVFSFFEPFTDEREDAVSRLSREPAPMNAPCRIIPQSAVKESIEAFETHNCLHQAWSIDVYKTFGDLPLEGYYIDDVMCHFRAIAQGSTAVIPGVLAYIRRGSDNMSTGAVNGRRGYSAIVQLERFLHKYHNTVVSPYKETLQHLAIYANSHSSSSLWYPALENYIKSLLYQNEQMSSYWSSSTMQRLRIRKCLNYKGVFSLLRCLPLPIYAFVLATYRWLKNMINRSR